MSRTDDRDSDAEIRAFFRERYGEFVLLRPGFDSTTWLLWAAPVLLACLGAAALTMLRAGPPVGEPEEGDR